MSEKTKVLIVDDHPVFRHGLRQIVEGDPQFQVVAEAGDGETALAQIQALKPAVVVIDIKLPKLSGLDLLRQLRDAASSTACLMLTMDADETTFNAAMDAGARGYMLKDTAMEAVPVGLRAVAAGGMYICPSVSRFLLKRRERAAALKEEKSGLASLTPTERRVLELVSENKTNKDIATTLFISPRTVETHRTNLCRKLQLQGAHKLLQFAIEHRSEL